MPSSRFCVFVLTVLLGCASQLALAAISSSSPNTTNQAQVVQAYGKLPMSFEANQGQTDAAVKFLARGPGYALFVKPDEAVLTFSQAGTGKAAKTAKSKTAIPKYEPPPEAKANPSVPIAIDMERRGSHEDRGNGQALKSAAIRMKLVGANPNAEVTGLDELPGKANYFRGNDPKQWHTGISTYRKAKNPPSLSRH